MNYPITRSELAKDLATDDEQATMIFIEAMLSGDLQALEISDSADIQTLKDKVENWEKLDEYKQIISSQKHILSRTIGGSIEIQSPSSADDLADSKILALHAFEKAKNGARTKKRNQIYSSMSMAACVLILVVGLSTFFNFDENETNSKTSRIASAETKTAPTKTGPAVESFSDDTDSSKVQGPDSVDSPQVTTQVTKDQESLGRKLKDAGQKSSSVPSSDNSNQRTAYLIGLCLAGISFFILSVMLLRKKYQL